MPTPPRRGVPTTEFDYAFPDLKLDGPESESTVTALVGACKDTGAVLLPYARAQDPEDE